MTARIFINGFGRIGRSVLRALLARDEDLEVVGINDIAPLETCAYLFEFDSVFGPWRGTVKTDGDALVVDGRRFQFHRTPDIRTLRLGGVDLVMECTGHAETRPEVERGLLAGAGRVLMSGPSGVADSTVVIGANEGALAPQMRVVSNASCTTNAVAPLVRILDDAFGVVTGTMTTIHCYTGSQPTVDKPTGGLARSRAAALSMVPTTTSAGLLVDIVLPHLAGRVVCTSVRVPVASVSAVDLTVQLARPCDAAAVNAAIAAAVGPVIGLTDKPLVSSDLRARPESYIHAAPETFVTDAGLLRVFGWYDNEWGFAHRMIDMAVRMTAMERV
jgi:glyceraldehyde 3-phosphate dehydrogenase